MTPIPSGAGGPRVRRHPCAHAPTVWQRLAVSRQRVAATDSEMIQFGIKLIQIDAIRRNKIRPLRGLSSRRVSCRRGANNLLSLSLASSIHGFTGTFADRVVMRHPASAAARRLIDRWIASDCGAKGQEVVSKLLNRAEDVTLRCRMSFRNLLFDRNRPHQTNTGSRGGT